MLRDSDLPLYLISLHKKRLIFWLNADYVSSMKEPQLHRNFLKDTGYLTLINIIIHPIVACCLCQTFEAIGSGGIHSHANENDAEV